MNDLVLRYTLIADGSSDKTLLNIVKWSLDDLFPELPNKGEFADFRGMPKPPSKNDAAAQVRRAQSLYPCDILFYHRDAENRKTKQIIDIRKDEILSHLNESAQSRFVLFLL